jgi:hypothetical protein
MVIVKIKGKPRSLFCNKRKVIGKLMHIIINYSENKYVELMIDYLRFYIPLKNISLNYVETSPLPVKGCKI